MISDEVTIRGNKSIIIKVDCDAGYLEYETTIESVNSAVGTFHDYLEKMIDNAQFINISCTLKE